VFISHFTGEKAIAKELQDLLKECFPGLQVFRSSDADSIETGEGQYSAILSALRSAEILIVLLSSESANRPWVAFETGYGRGKSATVLPWAVRGAKATHLPSPFSEMMVREVTADEVGKLLDLIEERTKLSRRPVDVQKFIKRIDAAGSAIPDIKLELEPFLNPERTQLQFRLHYHGYKPLTLQAVVVGIPEYVKDPSWPPQSVPGHLQIDRKTVAGTPYIFKEYLANSSPPSPHSGGHHFKVLKPKLFPDAQPDLWELRFALRMNTDIFSEEYKIHWWIETEEFRTREMLVPMSSLTPNATRQ
jgi:hypothetical protein